MTFKQDAQGRTLDRLAPGNWQQSTDPLVWVNMATAYRVVVVDIGGWRLQVFHPGDSKGTPLASPLAAGTTARDREDVEAAWAAWRRGDSDLGRIEGEGVLTQQVRLGVL